MVRSQVNIEAAHRKAGGGPRVKFFNTMTNPIPEKSVSNSLEIRREKWQRQLMADPRLLLIHIKVCLAIGFHMNRSRGGEAWPGISMLAGITCLHRTTVMRSTRELE